MCNKYYFPATVLFVIAIKKLYFSRRILIIHIFQMFFKILLEYNNLFKASFAYLEEGVQPPLITLRKESIILCLP